MAKESRKLSGKQSFRAVFDKQSIDVEKRTIDVVFVTERQVMMYNWDLGLFYEILPCDEARGDLSRLNNGAPLCDSHKTGSVRDGLGVVEKAWFEDGKGRATVRFSRRPDVEDIWNDVQDGVTTGISVGYLVTEYEEIGERENLPLIRANKWEALEISLALVQADADSAVGRSAQTPDTTDVIFIRKSNSNTMTPEEKAARELERKRSAEILKACRAAKLPETYAEELIEGEMSLEEARTAIAAKAKEAKPEDLTVAERTRISEIQRGTRAVGLPEEFYQRLVDEGTPLNEARAKIIDEAAKKNPVEPKPQGTGRVGADEKDKKQRGMEASILSRAGVLPADKFENPAEYRGMTLMDIGKECLREAGIEYRGLNQFEIAGLALQMTGGRSGGGGLATGDFAYVLANVMNKTLRAQYALQEKTFLSWTRKSTATDFRTMLRAQLNDIKLTQVQEGGDYQYSKLGDSGESYRVAKWGKIVNINWEAIVNDDLDAFSRIPGLLSGAVAQMQGDVVYAILTGSHLMGDGNQLFDATNHLNYTSSGTAISAASLGVGRQLIRDQKSPGGNVLNIAPKFLIAGSQNEALALQYTSQNYVATKQGDINVWSGLLTPIIDARVPAKNWFLAADPTSLDGIEWATIDGQEIYSESKYGWDVDALQWKVRSVFGAKAVEWRGLYKNTGA